MDRKICLSAHLWLIHHNDGRNKIIWCPEEEASLALPCLKLRTFGSKFTVLKNVHVTLLGLFGASCSHLAPPAVIRWPHSPHSDSAPGELCPPLTPLVTPLTTTNMTRCFGTKMTGSIAYKQCNLGSTQKLCFLCAFMLSRKKISFQLGRF